MGHTLPAKRRWFQYRLRTLLAAITLLAVALSWAGTKLAEQRGEEAAAGTIRKIHGRVDREGGPEWLRRLLGKDWFSTIVAVTLDGTGATDRDLVHVESLRHLSSLCLNGTQITDAGLGHLEGLRELKSLDLVGTRITDAGLAHIRRLDRLESLRLEHTGIGDAGLRHLTELRRLKALYLSFTNVTMQGQDELEAQLPDCVSFADHLDQQRQAILDFEDGCKDVESGDYEGAIGHLTTAIEAWPDFEQAFRERSSAWLKKGDAAAAGRDLKKAEELRRLGHAAPSKIDRRRHPWGL